MKVLVTGSSGFLARHLVNLLLLQGFTVLGVDILPPTEGSARFAFEICDITERAPLASVVADFAPQMVLHLAARTDLDGQRIEDYATNTVGVENLVSIIRETPSIKRCIFTSSQLVCEIGYVPIHDQDYRPNTLYGESKVVTEKIVRQSDGGGIEWCLVRPTTVWGPGMNEHYQSFFKLIKAGRYFHVGQDPLYKSYGYVGNVVHQYLRLLEAPASQINRKVFYAADYQPLSLREWANAFQRVLAHRVFPRFLRRWRLG